MLKRYPSLLQLRYPLIAFILILSILVLHKSFYARPSTTSIEQQIHSVMITPVGFVPKQLKYKKGDVISLRIVNIDKRTHNFVINELQVFSANLEPSQSATISFTASKEGSFPFISNSPGYPELGYKGHLVIE